MSKKARNSLIYIIIILIISLLVFGYIASSSERQEPEFAFYWSCMDGCSNMQELIYTDYDYYNDSMKNLHDKCTTRCGKQYTK